MRRKYRLAVLDDITLREVFHMQLSGLGTLTVFMLLFLALMIILSLLIVYTPIRNILPGYSESLRQQLIYESARVDSLQTSLQVQRQYLDVIKQLTAGDIQTDSVQSLDSLQIVQRTQILEQRNEITDAFIDQYEQKEKERMLLFDSQDTRSVRQLIRPVRGVVEQSARPDRHQYATAIRTAKNENVLALIRGTIIGVERAEDNTFTIILQQKQYSCIYRHVTKALKTQGTQVEEGETIGLMNGEEFLLLEIWEAGKFINPEDVIVF